MSTISIEELVNDISMSIVMLDETLPEDALRGVLAELSKLADVTKDSEPKLAERTLLLIKRSSELKASELLAVLKSFASEAQSLVRKSENTSPPTAPESGGEESLPEGANLDLLNELMTEGVKDTRVSAPPPPPPKVEAKKVVVEHEEVKPGGPVGESYQIVGDLDIFQEFCAEAEDHIGTVESTILDADGNYSKDSIDSIFRSIHSIKGSSSYFGLKEITETSHVTESLLDEVRDGERQFDQGLTDLVLAYLDVQRNLISAAKASISSGGTITRTEPTGQYLKKLHAYATGQQVERAVVKDTGSSPAPSAEQVAASAPAEEEVNKADKHDKGEGTEVKTFVKIETKRLDQLIDAIGELGIYCSMLTQHCRTHLSNNESLLKVTHQVEKVTRDVQNIGMSMRLIPIRGLFQKMNRLVLDLSKKVGKEIKFTMDGEDTELDRNIIDKLADPLMHMIRNALDHGVEPPEERESKGKARVGRVKLSAYHSGGSIHIRIEDDGRGMDPEKLIKKAREKGIITANQVLSREEAFQLIFAAGFSTAAVVTDVSGRGVGMDVVKRNIESLRGRVHITSEIGKGTIFTIELPLTLAIMDGIEVLVGSEHFIVPMLAVIEFMRPAPGTITKTFDRGETFHFRGRYLPIFRLGDLFGVEPQHQNPMDASLVVVDCHGEQYALMVDHVVGGLSTVIKSLGSLFEQGKGLSGCCIMSQGDVALILDVATLLKLAREFYRHEQRGYPRPGVDSTPTVEQIQ